MNVPLRKRAISPIIATLLLILIAIAAGVVVYAYVIGFVGGATTGQGTGTSQFQVVTESATASTGVVQLYVQNTGGSTFSLDQIYETTPTGSVSQITAPTSAVATIKCNTGATCSTILVSSVALKTSTTFSSSLSNANWEADVLVATSGSLSAGTVDVTVTLYFGQLLTGSVTIKAAGVTTLPGVTLTAISSLVGGAYTVPAISIGSSGSVVTTATQADSTFSAINSGTGVSTAGSTATSTFDMLTSKYSSTTSATFNQGTAAQAVMFVSPNSASGLTTGGLYTYKMTTQDGSSQVVSAKAK